MIKIYNYKDLDLDSFVKICERKSTFSKEVIDKVKTIGYLIKKGGDKALKRIIKDIDDVVLNDFKVSKEEFDFADENVSGDLKKAVLNAKSNIFGFHKLQYNEIKQKTIFEGTLGVKCWREFKSLNSVGLYIPSGTAPLFSTVLMLCIPALIAKIKNVYLVTPCDKKGFVAKEILWTAKMLGIENIYKIGGAQAIFALSCGTETIPKVDKIFGPGNDYVTQAKIQVSNHTAIDMIAGPSEVLVIADKKSSAKFVAMDLLSQAEHGTNSQAILVCDDFNKLKEIEKEIKKEIEKLPRKEIAKKAMENSFFILSENILQSFEISNIYAPEHLILSLDGFEKYLDIIDNAGSVFCGSFTPESLGDYASGTNHTLPTSGFVKSRGGIGIEDFGKWITFQNATEDGLKNISNTVMVMAKNENLDAHSKAVEIRIIENSLKKDKVN